MVTSTPPLTSWLHQKQPEIEDFLAQQWRLLPRVFYASVDVRRSQHRVAVVDTNLFPGGFNNLHELDRPHAAQAFATMLQHYCGHDNPRVLLVPESHTRNSFYLENVYALTSLLRQAGADVRIASLSLTRSEKFTLASGHQLCFQPFCCKQGQLMTVGFAPELVLLNNDLSSGMPEALQRTTQLMQPLPDLGWHRRRKSTHFACYAEQAQLLAQRIGLDPWLINPLAQTVDNMDWRQHAPVDELCDKVSAMLTATAIKYREYGITEQPFVIVKANSGTYGMAVLSVRDPSALKNLNRKQKEKMSVAKNRLVVDSLMIQEGIPTVEQYHSHAAESVLYMAGTEVIGQFYRINSERADDQNLNAAGMYFEPAHWHSQKQQSEHYAASVVARLALLAAAMEQQLLTTPTVQAPS